MSGAKRSLVVGIGSPHADDQAGWLVIDELSASQFNDARLVKASSPHDLMDWMDTCDILHIVDACKGSGDSVLRIDLSDSSRPTHLNVLHRQHSSHHIDILSVIELGRLLGKLPDRILMWAIPGEHFEPSLKVSDSCLNQVQSCARLVVEAVAASQAQRQTSEAQRSES